MVRPWRNLLWMFFIAYSRVLLLFFSYFMQESFLYNLYIKSELHPSHYLLCCFFYCMHFSTCTIFFLLFLNFMWLRPCEIRLVPFSYCIIIHLRVLTLVCYYECSIWLGKPPLCVFKLHFAWNMRLCHVTFDVAQTFQNSPSAAYALHVSQYLQNIAFFIALHLSRLVVFEKN